MSTPHKIGLCMLLGPVAVLVLYMLGVGVCHDPLDSAIIVGVLAYIVTAARLLFIDT